MKRISFAALALLAGIPGCWTPAKVVQRPTDSVVIAIPENTDVWPTHYRAAAEALAKQELGTSYIKVDEKEVVVGANNATPTSSTGAATKQYRITYIKKPPQQIPLGGPLPTGVGARPLPSGAGLGAGVQPAGGNVPNAYQPGGMTGAGSMPMSGTMNASMGGGAMGTGSMGSGAMGTGSMGSGAMGNSAIPNVGPAGGTYPYTPSNVRQN